ncbi:hypothetical protein OB03_05775 [Brevundimonas sp. GN22]
MKRKPWLNEQRLERIETAYLQALRIGGLLVATLCLLGALYFAGDALWRLAVKTEVAPEATAVDTAALAREVATQPKASDAKDTDYLKSEHDRFAKDVWPKYYSIYKKAFDAHRNTSDQLISSDDMMAALGYDLDSYRQAYADDAPDYIKSIRRMVDDAAYQQAALKHVQEIMTAAPVVSKLTAYKSASKSEQRCTTTPRTERVARVCGYYYVYDCSYTRTVQDRRCEAVFPDSVMTPAAAFERADAVFASSWLGDEAAKRSTAVEESEKRQLLRGGIGPRLQLAFLIIGGFFVVMFFFLLVAIERHLRRRPIA